MPPGGVLAETANATESSTPSFANNLTRPFLVIREEVYRNRFGSQCIQDQKARTDRMVPFTIEELE